MQLRGAKRREKLLRETAQGWRVEQEGFDPSREREMEALFCQGNGYLGSRGFAIPRLPSSYADLMIAGIYDRKAAQRPYSETEFLSGDLRGNALSELVSFPSPFQVGLRIEGREIAAGGLETARHHRVLELRHGVLLEHFLFRAPSLGSLKLGSLRCIPLEARSVMLQELWLDKMSEEVENETLAVELQFAWANQDLELVHPHLKLLGEERMVSDPVLGEVHQCLYETRYSGFRICFLSQMLVCQEGERELRPIRNLSSSFELRSGGGIKIQRRTVVATSREVRGSARGVSQIVSELVSLARDRLARMGEFETQIAQNSEAWARFWQSSDIQFGNQPGLEKLQRFNLYQLRIAADPVREEQLPCFSVPARGLSGRAYEGHIFWDADVFIAPFFLYTEPEIARNMACYRYQTLEGARDRARRMGYRGACYAWESTLTGEDVTPRLIALKSAGVRVPIFTGQQQIHVTADVAYSIWQYWDATGDREFLARQGAEILVETARFWVSRVDFHHESYHIRGVVGPDEYHHSVDDNAYTNWMARFNLEKAAWVVDWLQREYPDALGSLNSQESLSEEASRWREIAKRIYFPIREDGVIEQFAGFFDLREVVLGTEEIFRPPVARLFEWEKVNQLKVLKQADVLMIFFLFPDAFGREVVDANYQYYHRLTDHGSSLSAPVHAAIAAQVGRRGEAESYWAKSISFDLKNLMNNTSLGIHLGCMGAAWQALVFHLLGVRIGPLGPALPVRAWERLPKGCDELRLALCYRGERYPLVIREPSGGDGR